ncbi:MAG: TatD family hydrolase [Candidatus Levybacteria bacterium]|nr:TatD family hydrolase [Candidatus Levybacteria bacterium]
MIDVHCHLNFHAFEKDYDEVIKSALEAGVTKIINVGTKIDSSEKAIELAKKYDNLYAIVGVHPHHADKIQNENVILGTQSEAWRTPESDSGQARMTATNWLKQLEQVAKKPKVVAIGEIGMDYFSYRSNDIVDPRLQKDVFIKQIELAHKLKLPLQIHNRQAGKDIIDILLNHKSHLLNPPGMFHCFAGSIDILKSALQMGFYVGFDGNITYNGLAPGEDTDLKTLAKYTPIDRILVETDSPFLTPEPMRGSRNVPSYVIITGKFIASLKGLTFADFEAKTTANAVKLFSL